MKSTAPAQLNARAAEVEKTTSDTSIHASRNGERVDLMSRRKFLIIAGTGTVTAGFFGGAVAWDSVTSSTDSDRAEGRVIEPPVHGEWLVMNPPGHPEHATDVIGMKEGHRLPYPATSVPHHLFSRMPVSRAYGFGQPVYAPAGGTVLGTSVHEADLTRMNLVRDAADILISPPTTDGDDIRPTAGNYVLIDSGRGIAFLAHLQQGSVAVEKGEHVTPGQFIGNVGNSGASLFPHLHFQLMSEWTTDLSQVEDVLLPYRFSEYEERTGRWLRGTSWTTVKNRAPKRGVRFRIPRDRDGSE